MDERVKRSERIERLVEFIKKYPELWKENVIEPDNERLILKYVDEYISEKKCEESREELIQKLKLAERDYLKIREKIFRGALTSEELETLREGRVGRRAGYSREIEDLAKGKKNEDGLKKFLYNCDMKYGSIDNFRKAYIEQIATIGSLENFPYVDGMESIHFDIASPNLHNKVYDKLVDSLVEKGNDETSLRIIDSDKIKDAIVNALSLKEQMILEERYGLGMVGPKKFQEIASDYGVIPERIRQIVVRSVRKLKPYKNQILIELNNAEREKFIRTYFEHHDIFEDSSRKEIDEEVKKNLLKIMSRVLGEENTEETEEIKNERPIIELGFTTRTYNTLKRAGICTVDKLTSRSKTNIRYIKHLGSRGFDEIINKIEEEGLTFAEEDEEEKQRKEILDTPLSELNLSTRSYNILHRNDIETVGDLINKTKKDFDRVKGFGEGAYLEVEEKLHSMGLSFTDEVEQEDIVEEKREGKATLISEIGLSVRTLRCLDRAGIKTVGDYMSKSEKELSRIRNFGESARAEITEKINSLELLKNEDNVEDKSSVLQSGVEATEISSRTGKIIEQMQQINELQNEKENEDISKKGEENEN